VLPAPVQGALLPTGVPLALTATQIPPLLQYSHWPAHGPLQQTPSTQLPLEHSPARPQLEPNPLRPTQRPVAAQYELGT